MKTTFLDFEQSIAELESKLSNAQIINPALLDADGRCVFGATVELEDMSKSEVVTYQTGGDDEADIKEGKISISSPIAGRPWPRPWSESPIRCEG